MSDDVGAVNIVLKEVDGRDGGMRWGRGQVYIEYRREEQDG